MDSKLLEKVLAESGNAADQVAEMNARYAAIGLSVPSSDMFLGGQLKPRRLKPPCDYCGQADGTKKCTSCKCAHYCSKECQVGDWQAGHKRACGDFQASCAAAAARVVGALSNASLLPHERVADLGDLDREGPFGAALDAGLWPTLEVLLLQDAAEVVARFTPGSGNTAGKVCCAQWVSNVLFRGQRGVRVGGEEAAGHNKSDGERCASFVASSEGAWGAWLAAAVSVGRAPLQRAVRLSAPSHVQAHRAARDVWCGLGMALARRELAGALFFVPPGQDGYGSEPAATSADGTAGGDDATAIAPPRAAAQSRAKVFAETMQAFLKDLWTSPEGADLNSTIEANAFQAVALVCLWCEELNVGFDVEAALKMDKTKRTTFHTFTMPTAAAMKAKGAMLTMHESNAALRAAAASTGTKKDAKKGIKKGKRGGGN
jgi:hypothetical protein